MANPRIVEAAPTVMGRLFRPADAIGHRVTIGGLGRAQGGRHSGTSEGVHLPVLRTDIFAKVGGLGILFGEPDVVRDPLKVSSRRVSTGSFEFSASV